MKIGTGLDISLASLKTTYTDSAGARFPNRTEIPEQVGNDGTGRE